MPIRPDTAVDDAFRLLALQRTGVGDPSQAGGFDELSAAAAAAADAPTAMVSLVDAERQVFAGACGLHEPWASRRETPLSHSFCRHVVDAGQPVVVSDARADARFRDHEGIDALGIAAYLGVPLVSEDGHVYGALCAVDTHPRTWSVEATAALERLARDVALDLDRRRSEEETLLAANALAGQSALLSAVAAGAPLADVLQALVERIEQERADVIASILLVDDSGHLRHGAAPSLPRGYREAIDGVPSGPQVGSCGTAVHRGEAVIVEDVTTDPLWSDFREIAARYGLRACWSVPVVASDGAVIATFALYHGAPSRPSPADLALLEQARQLASIAIEQTRARDRMHASEARYRAMVETIVDAVVTIGEDGLIEAANAAVERMFGYTADELTGQPVTLLMPERYRAAHRAGLARALAAPAPPATRPELRGDGRRRDGSEFPLSVAIGESRGYGGRRTFTAILKDISAQVAIEDELRRSEATQRELAERQTALARDHAALRRVATAVAEELEPERLFALVAGEVADLLGVEQVTIGRYVRDDEVLVLGSRSPLEHGSHEVGARRALSPESIMRTVRHTRRVESREVDDPVDPPLRYRMAAPIRLAGGLWGVVGAATDAPGALDDVAAERMTGFAELIGTAVSNGEARAALAARASSDALTGLQNHRTFHASLREEVARAHRTGAPLSLVLFDLDRFKAVNDTHGHPAGDRVLVETAERLRRHADDGVLGRVGGEEFALLLPGLDAVRALTRAEGARAAVAGAPFEDLGILTISAGVCDLTAARTAERLYELADGALYWAKAHGRNACVRYTEDAVEELSAQERAERLERRQALTSLRVLARAVDARDPSTQRHSERVADHAARIAAALGWTPERVAQLHDAGLVHDVGKIGIPDSILLKPARLDPDEYEQIKTHSALGAQMVVDVLLPEQVAWIRHHHERVDGRGYPDGLAGSAIPEGARILALADAWDVMTSDRPYQRPRSRDDALAECRAHAGTHFCCEALRGLERTLAPGSAHGAAA